MKQQYLSRQEIATRVFSHLLKQGVAAVNEDTGFCEYRNSQGHMCAVGCLIEPHLYEVGIEGVSLVDIDVDDVTHESREATLLYVLNLSGINTDDVTTMNMLADMQQLHDSRTKGSVWDKATLFRAAKLNAERFGTLQQLIEVTGEFNAE